MSTRWAAFVAAAVLSAPGARAGESPARAAIESLIAASSAEVAVAFRTLDGRDELFLRAEDSFHAASTMKVPVLVELYARSAEGGLDLGETIELRNEFASIVDGSPYALDPASDEDPALYERLGGRATARELAERMVTVSSNLAVNLLIARLGAESVQRRVEALGAHGLVVRRGVEDGKAYEAGLNNTTTARGLLVLFEAIARHEALGAKSGEEVLAILKRQRLRDAIPAGLPDGTPVAHKTGTITRIHHDAGIVYAARPFVLVVLVRGIEDQAESARLIAGIARRLYEETQAGAVPP